jgi:hypothetical protein
MIEPETSSCVIFSPSYIGSGGTGKRICISGYEPWKIGNHGPISESKGHFDSAE